MYSGYGIAFGILSSCCYGNDFASNILSFDNCSSFHADNCKKKNFSVRWTTNSWY